MQTAVDELETLKSQLSGVEAAVTLIKTYGPSVPGRSSPSHGRRAAQQLTATHSSTSPRSGSGSPTHRLHLHQQNPAVAGGKLAAPKPAASAASPFAGASVPSAPAGHLSHPISNSNGRSSPCAAKSGFSSLVGNGSGQSPRSKVQHSSMTEPEMQAVIQVRPVVVQCCAACPASCRRRCYLGFVLTVSHFSTCISDARMA